MRGLLALLLVVLLSGLLHSALPLTAYVIGMLALAAWRNRRGTQLRLYWQIRLSILLQSTLVLAVVAVAIGLLLSLDNPILNFSWLTLLAPQLGDAPGGIGGPSSAGGGPGAGEPPPGNIILEPLAYRWLAVPFLLLLLFVLPSLAAAEERLFRQGTRGWRQGLVRSLIFGLAHWPMGIPLGAALALSIGGLWFTYQYFRGGVARSTIYHLTYNLLAILLIVLLLAIPWG